MEMGIGTAVNFIAREEVARIAARGIGGEFGAQIGDDGDGAGGELALSIALADDDFGADCAFRVEDIALSQGDGFGDPTGSVETDGKQGAISGGIYGEAFIKEQLNLGDGEDFCLPVAVDLHGFPPAWLSSFNRYAGVKVKLGGRKFRSLLSFLIFEGVIIQILKGYWNRRCCQH